MRVLIAIPVYNEEKYLPTALEQIRRHAAGCDILAINDGSTDRSGEILAEHPDIRLHAHETNQGYGHTVADAFRLAAEYEYDWVITMDADEQHDPALIPEFLRIAELDRSDVISGSRYMREHPSYEQVPGDRRQVNHLITVLLKHSLGLDLTDSFCGFKAHRVEAMRRLNLTVTGYAFPLQFWVQCVRAGLRIEELPVTLIYHDPNRRFGGGLDDSAVRLKHYIEVLTQELEHPAGPSPSVERSAFACRCSRC